MVAYYIMLMMNNKHRKTLQKIMTTPVLASICFDELVVCMLAMGYTLEQREGSRIAFIIQDEELSLHKPHPNKEIKKYVVRNVAQFINDTKNML